MANSDKDILITPNGSSSSADPKIEYVGADSSGNDTITVETLYDGTKATLSFEGSAGQLFSIVNDLSSDPIFSVNDVSGIPSIEVDSDGEVRIAEFSGDVIFGKSTANNTDVGTTIYNGAGMSVVRSGGAAVILNRTTSDGTIQEFRKDGTAVGRIGTYSGGLVIGNGDTGLRMQDSINAIYAFNVTTGANRDSAVDIGASSVKFKDLYLSGTANVGNINTGQGATEVYLMNQNVRSSDSPTFADLTVTGNLNITGDINSYNVTDLDVTDKTITLGVGQTEANSGSSGIIIDGSAASMLWDEGDNRWEFNKNIYAPVLYGSGAGITSLNASNLGSGTVPSARLSLSASDIPNLAASKITSGTFADARIAASSITQHTDPKYLRSDANDTYTGTLSVAGTIQDSGDSRRIHYMYGTTSSQPAFGLGEQGTYGMKMRWDSSTNIEFDGFWNTSVTGARNRDLGDINVNTAVWSFPTGVRINGNTAWHAGNDGASSGLDADLLDGQHGTYYNHRRYTDSTNYLGGYYVSGGAEKPNSSALGAGKLKPIMLGSSNLGFGGAWNDVLWMSTYTGTDVKRSTAFVSSKYDNTSVWVVKQNYDSSSWGTGYLFWNSGNDGSGSGLDADLLDAQHGSYYLDYNNFTNTPTIPTNNNQLTNGAGYITSADGGNATTLDSLDSTQFLRSDTSDTMNFNTTSGEMLKFSNGTSGGKIQIGFQQNDSDGMHHRAYFKAYKAPNTSGNATGRFDLVVRGSGGSTTSDILALEASRSATWRGNTLWDSANDGSGSGLDADLLDGQHGSYYLNYNNFTNTPTIPTNNNQLTNGAGYITSFDITTQTDPKYLRSNVDDTTSGNITITKTSPTITLNDNNTGTSSYPAIQFDTSNNQGVRLEHNEFDGELPAAGYGLVLKESSNNSQFPSTGTLSFNVLGEIYAGATSLGSLQRVFHNGYHPNADKLTTARTIAGSSFDGTANISIDYNNLTNLPTIPSLSGYATESYVNTQVSNLVDSAPGTLNTLNELAAALGDDANFSTTVTNSIATKLPLSGGTITGGLTISGSVASGGTDYGLYQNAGTNLVLKGDSNGRSGIFFQSEKNGTNINHPSDYGFIQFHPYGYGNTSGEVINMVIGTANDSNDQLILQTPYTTGLKFGYRNSTSGTGLTTGSIWHFANDGSGSGLDADLLDGVQASQFLRSDAADTATQPITLSGGSGTSAGLVINRNIATPSNYYSGLQIEVRATSGTAGIGLHRNGYSHVGIYTNAQNRLDFDFNSGDVIMNHNAGTLWGSGNDGSGSGLDADLLDGNHASAFLGVSAKAADSNLFDGIDSANFVYGSGSRRTNNSDPNSALNSGFYDVYQTNAPTSTWYSYITMAHTNTGNQHGHQIAGSFYSDGDIYNRHYDGTTASFGNWTKIWNAANDGSGSGLDADLLDGLQGTQYIRKVRSRIHSADSTSMDTTLIGSTEQGFNYGTSSGVTGPYLTFGGLGTGIGNYQCQLNAAYSSGGTAFKFRTRNDDTASWNSWYTLWNSGNDGSGSGLDADTVDGIQGGSFLRSDASDTATGSIVFSGATQYFRRNDTTNYTNAPLMVESYGGSSSSTGIGFHISGQLGRYLRMNSSGVLAWEGSTIWHAGNDGSGSGLDADLWDGNQFSTYLNQAVLTSSSPTFSQVNATSNTDATGYRLRASQEVLSGEGWCTALYNYNVNDGFLVLRRDGSNNALPHFHISGYNNPGYAGHTDGDGMVTLTRSTSAKATGTTYAGTGLQNTSDWSRWVKNTTSTVFEDGDDNWQFGVDGDNPRITLLFDDHASGAIWDTAIELGRSDKFRNSSGSGTVGPSYITDAGNAYGLNIQANSDGAFFGIEQYTSGHYRPVIAWGDDTTDNPFFIKFNNSPEFAFTYNGVFHADNDIIAFSSTTTSDRKLKENIRDLEGSLDKTLKLRGVKFDWKDKNKTGDQLGFIAQEVQEVLPEVVKEVESIGDRLGETHLTVNYPAVIPVLVEAIKEQQETINKLTRRINDIEKGE